MSRGVGALNVSVNASTGVARNELLKLRSEINALPGSMGGARTSMTALGAATLGLTAAAAGAAGVWALVAPSMDEIDGLAKASDKLGITTEKLAGLRLAAEESDVSVGNFDKGLVKMLRSVAEVSGGVGEAKDAFAALGLNASQMIAMSPDEQFRLIAEAMEGIPSSAEKLDVAMSIFGRAGADMVNVLALGKEGMDEAQQAAERLGLAISRDAAEKVEKANDAMGRIGKSATGLGHSLAIALAPAIETTSYALTDLVKGISQDIPYFLGLIGEVDHAAQERELSAKRIEAAAKVQAEAERDLNKAYEKQLELLRDQLAVAKDPAHAQYDKDVKEFGEGRAGNLLQVRDLVENEKLKKEKEAAAERDKERQKAEADRKKQQEEREAEKRHQDNLKRDAEVLRDLRERVANFGKSESEIERERMLQELDDPAQREEAKGHFEQLDRLQKDRDSLDKLKSDRDVIAGRGANNILDARTTEGWAQLRSSVKDPQLAKLDEQIALMKEANRLAAAGKKEEVFDF